MDIDEAQKLTELVEKLEALTKPLTDAQIDEIAESMPGGVDGFLKGWGWRQFARAIEREHGM